MARSTTWWKWSELDWLDKIQHCWGATFIIHMIHLQLLVQKCSRITHRDNNIYILYTAQNTLDFFLMKYTQYTDWFAQKRVRTMCQQPKDLKWSTVAFGPIMLP